MTAQPLIQWPLQGESRVPYRVFSGDDVHRREQERIFRGKTWTFVGLEADVPRTGDFRTAQVGDAQVVVARDADGEIYVFENRCAHRGALIEATAKSVSNFLVIRIMENGETLLFASGRYLDRIALAPEPRYEERVAICDSRRFDTLLAIPL